MSGSLESIYDEDALIGSWRPAPPSRNIKYCGQYARKMEAIAKQLVRKLEDDGLKDDFFQEIDAYYELQLEYIEKS